MEAARWSGGPQAPRLERAHLALLGVLLALAVVAWLVTSDRMGGMESMPGQSLGGFGFYLTLWVVMMAAMMFPSVAPTVLAYNRLRESHRAAGTGAAADATGLFVCGYLVVWTAAGLGAYAVFEVVGAIDPAFLAWDEAGKYVAGAAIVGTAVYQVTPMKRACLVKCRQPTEFLAARWRDGRAGALELGIRHGAWCLGCCWALMLVLFAVGVMSLWWMALIAAFIAAEKLLPWPAVARTAVAASLLALGFGVAFAPAEVPGFAEPENDMHGGSGHGDAMHMSH